MSTIQLNASYPQWSYDHTYPYSEALQGAHIQRSDVEPLYGARGPHISTVDHQEYNWNFGNMNTTPDRDRSPSPSPMEETVAIDAHYGSPSESERPAKRLRSGNLIPRPRNAFIIFRSERCKDLKKVERDHRLISKIIASCWKKLSVQERSVWKLRAMKEKEEHYRKYPDYKFTPKYRTKTPAKRKVNRTGKSEATRCEKISDLLLAGKQGVELDVEVQRLQLTDELQDARSHSTSPTAPSAPAHERMGTITLSLPQSGPSDYSSDEDVSAPVFRSPLLPPADLPPQLRLDLPLAQTENTMLPYSNGYSTLFQGTTMSVQQHASTPSPTFTPSPSSDYGRTDSWSSPSQYSHSFDFVPYQYMQGATNFSGHYMIEGDRSAPPLLNPSAGSRHASPVNGSSPSLMGPLQRRPMGRNYRHDVL